MKGWHLLPIVLHSWYTIFQSPQSIQNAWCTSAFLLSTKKGVCRLHFYGNFHSVSPMVWVCDMINNSLLVFFLLLLLSITDINFLVLSCLIITSQRKNLIGECECHHMHGMEVHKIINQNKTKAERTSAHLSTKQLQLHWRIPDALINTTSKFKYNKVKGK